LRHIRLRTYVFGFISALGAITCALLISFGVVSAGASAYLLLAVMFSASVTSAILSICEFRKLNIARLITENPILNIRTAVIRDLSNETGRTKHADSEAFVSYFGILLDSKLIKFNQDGIRLLAVEFGPDNISLTYGTGNRIQSTRLLRPAISHEEINVIVEKFRYETGIVPDIK